MLNRFRVGTRRTEEEGGTSSVSSPSKFEELNSPLSSATASTADLSDAEQQPLLIDDEKKVHHTRFLSCNIPMLPCCFSSTSRKLPTVSLSVLFSAVVWFGMGVVAICTTKILLMKVPPLVLTLQQLTLSSCLLRIVLRFRDGGAQPLPWRKNSDSQSVALLQTPNREFILAGFFNGLDFLASNSAFSGSAPSFVETIKSSDPVTTTAVALIFRMDVVSGIVEWFALSMILLGVFLSTLGNEQESPAGAVLADVSFRESLTSAAIVIVANLCFAFRAVNQKRYQQRSEESGTLDDTNLLCRMQQTGALCLLPLALIIYSDTILSAVSETQPSDRIEYIQLAVGNSVAFVSYNLAACMVLTKVGMLTYSGLNCVRRMFCVLCTCIFFGVPISLVGGLGIVAVFSGFGLFTFQRGKPPSNGRKKSKATDDGV